jgi:L-serine deaminase
LIAGTFGAQETPDLAKTVDVALDVKGNSSASRDLSFARFSAIRTIQVNSVTYADGSTWHAPSPGACSVAPSPIMQVSAQ